MLLAVMQWTGLVIAVLLLASAITGVIEAFRGTVVPLERLGLLALVLLLAAGALFRANPATGVGATLLAGLAVSLIGFLVSACRMMRPQLAGDGDGLTAALRSAWPTTMFFREIDALHGARIYWFDGPSVEQAAAVVSDEAVTLTRSYSAAVTAQILLDLADSGREITWGAALAGARGDRTGRVPMAEARDWASCFETDTTDALPHEMWCALPAQRPQISDTVGAADPVLTFELALLTTWPDDPITLHPTCAELELAWVDGPAMDDVLTLAEDLGLTQMHLICERTITAASTAQLVLDAITARSPNELAPEHLTALWVADRTSLTISKAAATLARSLCLTGEFAPADIGRLWKRALLTRREQPSGGEGEGAAG